MLKKERDYLNRRERIRIYRLLGMLFAILGAIIHGCYMIWHYLRAIGWL